MSRGFPSIKSATLFETGSRKAAARLAKRVGTDLRQTASKVAQQGGFKNLTAAMDEWMNDPKYERVLFRDFLNEKINTRLGPGAAIPNSLTQENLGQGGIKGKVQTTSLKDRQLAGFGAAEEGGNPDKEIQSKVGVPEGYKKPSVSGNIDGNAFSIMGAVSKALKSAGHKDLVAGYMKEAMSGDYDNLLRVSAALVKFKFSDGDDD